MLKKLTILLAASLHLSACATERLVNGDTFTQEGVTYGSVITEQTCRTETQEAV